MTSSPLSIDLLHRAVTGPAPGKSSDYDLNPGLRDQIARAAPLRAAAVLCPVIERDGVLRVILTVRAGHLNAHAGQVAFPGGKRDPSDKTLAAPPSSKIGAGMAAAVMLRRRARAPRSAPPTSAAPRRRTSARAPSTPPPAG